MNLIIIPFHDWRKGEREGFRTRDVHLINALSQLPEVQNVLIVNRPATPLELAFKNQSNKIKGEKLISKKRFALYKLGVNKFVITYCSNDILGQVFHRHLWFMKKYADQAYVEFINESLKFLGIQSYNLVNQNVFAYKLAEKLMPYNSVFDAWDNFIKFPRYASYSRALSRAYSELKESCSTWITNSTENMDVFRKNYGVQNIDLVRNGVNKRFVNDNVERPREFQKMKGLIIGFGGKITYLIDTELINYLSLKHPEANFVFVGQVLNKGVYRKIIKRKNVWFLGDIHYDHYNEYVQHFDICIIPYLTGSDAHGGDSIKAYEFLTAKKKVVGTPGNGLIALENYMYVAKNKEEFSKYLSNTHNKKEHIKPSEFTWENRARRIIKILSEQFENNFEFHKKQ